MRSRMMMMFLGVGLLLLWVAACAPVSVTNVMPAQAIQSGPSPTPAIPTGGTYADPVINLTGSCPTYQNFSLNLLYSPGNLTITRVGFMSNAGAVTCNPDGDGHTLCTGAANPYINPLVLNVCFRGPDSVEETCREVSMVTPGCPAPVASLLSVECPSEGRVRFNLDTAATWRFHECECSGPAGDLCNCTAGQNIYTCQSVWGTATETSCEGLAPAPGSVLRVAYFVEGMNIDTQEARSFVFEDFRSRYTQSCLTVAPPQPTNTVESPPVVPPAACSSYTDSAACGSAAGCYWWLVHGCNDKPDSCAGLDQKACQSNTACTWDGKSCYTP